MTRLFVTATGTGIGKSFVTAAVAAAARRAGRSILALKPLVTGFDPAELASSDPGVLLDAQGRPPAELDRIAPFRFAAPLSPDMAAAREGRRVDFDELIGFCRTALAGPEDVVLIEGIGGVMVPLDERRTVLDWIEALDIPVLLVAGSYLGTLSHTLTALAVLAGKQIPVRAVIIDESDDAPAPLAEIAGVIGRFAPGVPILTLNRQTGPEGWRDVPELLPLLG